MGGTARQGALPTSLNHDRRYIPFQRVGNLWFEPPVAAAIHLEPALEPIRHRRLDFRATPETMFHRLGSRLLAGLTPSAGIAPLNPLDARTAMDEHKLMCEDETGATDHGTRPHLV